MTTARMIGILGNVAVCIMVIVGAATSHWVDFLDGHGHSGLWQYCNLPKPNATNGSETTTPPNVKTTPVPRDEEDDDEEDECASFGLDHDAYLHIARAGMVVAIMFIAYGILKGETLKRDVTNEPSCLRRHSGEFLSLCGAAFVFLAVTVHRKNFETDSIYGQFVKEDSYGWSSGIALVAAYMTIPAVLLMMSPTLKEKLKVFSPFNTRESTMHRLCRNFKQDAFGSCYRFITCQTATRNRRNPHPVEVTITETGEPTTGPSSIHEASDISSESSFIEDGRGPNLSWMEDNNDDIFTIRVTNGRSGPTDTGNTPESYTDPAPAYEDLSPRSQLPEVPPPSYDDVITGIYTPTSADPSFQMLPPSSQHNLPSPSPSHPPPSYEQSL